MYNVVTSSSDWTIKRAMVHNNDDVLSEQIIIRNLRNVRIQWHAIVSITIQLINLMIWHMTIHALQRLQL